MKHTRERAWLWIPVLAGLAVVVALSLQREAIARLREENASLALKAEAADALVEAEARLKTLSIDEAELARLRPEHVELLRLRGEYALLERGGEIRAAESTNRATGEGNPP